MAGFKYTSFYISKSVLEATCRLNSSDLAKLQIEATEQGIDVYEVINKLNDKWRMSSKALGADGELDDIVLKRELQHENVQKQRIHNQTLLGKLISKVEAKARILKLLVKQRELLQEFIRWIANDRTREGAEPIDNTTRAWVGYLTNAFNAVFDLQVKQQYEIKNWEDDGSYQILRTRLTNAKNSNDIDKMILDQVGDE